MHILVETNDEDLSRLYNLLAIETSLPNVRRADVRYHLIHRCDILCPGIFQSTRRTMQPLIMSIIMRLTEDRSDNNI